MKIIDGRKMKELVEKRHANVIDIDTVTDFKKNHIKGSTCIPHIEEEFLYKVQRKFSEKDEEIVLCAWRRLEPKIKKLGKELENAGYKNVYQYNASPADWKNANLSIQSQV
jgi:rhodanese-related sulfurtransferase